MKRIKRFIGKILLSCINAHIEYVNAHAGSFTYKFKKGKVANKTWTSSSL